MFIFSKNILKRKIFYLGRANNIKNNKIRSIICSIYICYYIRLINDSKIQQRTTFESKIRALLLKLVNSKDEKSKLDELNKIIRKEEETKEKNKKFNDYIEKILDTTLTEEEKQKTRLEKDLSQSEKGNEEIIIKLSEEEEKIALQELKGDVQNLNPQEKQKVNDKKLRYYKEVKMKYMKFYENVEEKEGDLVQNFKNKELRNEIKRYNEIININAFSDFIKIEQDFFIEQIELDDGIGKNTLLKENIFLLFISLITNIPLIIIGKPGCGKSLSAQLIKKSMKGKYSNNKFFQLFPRIIQTYFQGSQSTQPDDVECLFERAGKKLEYYKKKKINDKDTELPISMVLFDELGLAERSESNPLKVLHSRLDYAGKEDGVSFVGISNYTLDAAKVNRALVLSVPDLDKNINEITETAKNIVQSISPNIKDDGIFVILSNTYFAYKQQLQTIKELVVFKKYVHNYVAPKENVNNNKTKDNDNIKGNLALNTLELGMQNNINPSQNKNIDKTVTSESVEQIKEEENKNEEDEKIKKNWNLIKLKPFRDIKEEKQFKVLMKKENRIRKDFHGNRDFYHLIKGTALELGKSNESTDEEKVRIIVKYIERNFGGIDYKIDIDFSYILEDIDKDVKSLQAILQNYFSYKEKNVVYLKSVYLFKALYNLQFKEKDPNRVLMIDPKKINDYNLNYCINENIWDNNSRYLLLEIEQNLTTLIYQNIKLQNILKEPIKLYDGSPFVDDNNKVYRFNKLNEIQEDAKQDRLIIIENLNQIHPFLFDLYNRNFQVVNGKKFARISLDNFDEQLTEVNDGFRIIILVEKRYVNRCDLAFLNRLEKIILSFRELLDDNLKKISQRLITDLNITKYIARYDQTLNYSLEDLLINCEDNEIQGLIYHFSIKANKDGNESDNEDTNEENIDEEQIRERVIDRIYKVLPQDIAIILPKNNILRNKYIASKNIDNFNDYMKEEYKKYKISIIYTFTNRVDGITTGKSFVISEIRSENNFLSLIEEIKDKYKNEEKKYICIHFEQSNSKNIKFISNFIFQKFEDDDFNYILIIHINRNFNKKVKDRIYSLPDINSKINQIFIDNLNNNSEIKITDILSNNIQNFFIANKDNLQLDKEFNKTLRNFMKRELSDKGMNFDGDTKFIDEMESFMEDSKIIKSKIMEITYKIIDDEFKNENSGIIDKILHDKLINNFTIDVISCICDYIKDKVFNKNLKILFKILEDNNILTTLVEIKKNNYDAILKETVDNIVVTYLDELEIKKDYIYNCRFKFNYNIPGLYNFFENISNYINKNIILSYFNNEVKLRKSLNNDNSIKKEFHKTEESLLDKLYMEVQTNYKLACKIIDMIDDNDNLILNDYISFYLQKYKKVDIINKDDIYHKIILLLLKLRFKINNNDIKYILLKRIIWIESNVNYILSILNIIDHAKSIFKDDILFYKKINEEIFKEDKIIINYITNEKRNPEITKEVNECYYILLAGICYCITSDDIELIEMNEDNLNNENKIRIDYYCDKLNEINKIIQALSDDLFIFLNEMYIIDELIRVIHIFKDKINIEKIKNIKKELSENANIIQNYFGKKDQFNFGTELIKNIETIYELITKNEDVNKLHKNHSYYKNLRYILLSEIKKISDTDYRAKIIEKLLGENEMIKYSNDIFQIVLKPYLKKNDKFKDNYKSILKGNDNIIKTIEDKLKNNVILEETLLYLFEKNSLIYFNYILENKMKYEEEPLQIFITCINYLIDYVKKTQKKELCKLFCLGFIKSYCFTFIDILNKEPIWEESKLIINAFNDKMNSIHKIIRLYIYKILYNKNKNSISFFYKDDNIKKFGLSNYSDFNNFIKNKDLNNIYRIKYQVPTLVDKFYEESAELMEKYKNEKFEKAIDKTKYFIDEYGIDNFFITSYNHTLSYLLLENSEINPNFYNNICKNLFKDKAIILRALQIFYEPKKYKDISKKYNINIENIKPFFFGYRYCLNVLASENTNGIYYNLYDPNKIDYLSKKLYPGNDTKCNIVYSQVINHFIEKPEQGCYVCFCPKMFYLSVKSGFPGAEEVGKTCQKCGLNMGAIKDGKEIKIVKRDHYFRILKDEDEANKIRNDVNNKTKLKDYMTLEKFKNEYIINSFKKEKGIYKCDANNFKNANKLIRNLSQISYRLLNYVLYSNLFFARIITNKDDFDNYIPKGLNWEDTIYICWNKLAVELMENKIESIEDFMYYIFPKLFPILNDIKIIDKYDDLISIEKKLDNEIKNLIKDFRKNPNIFKYDNKIDDKDSSFTMNLLTEEYNDVDIKIYNFPFYKYFYYTDYLNENYLSKKLVLKDVTEYPILNLYLQNHFKGYTEKNKNLLDKLHLFNDTLNLISQKYFNNISKELAEKKKLVNEGIYKNNKKLFDDFIDFINNLKIEHIKIKSKLSPNSHLNEFFIKDSNEFGKIYKMIYKYFIKLQNDSIKPFLELKVERGIFDINCTKTINIQQINEKEIFTLKLPKKVSFFDILFNSSYRKILDNNPINYKAYKEYDINFGLLEEIMTDLLLKNKKLLNEDVIEEFIYNNEVFTNQVTDLITTFKKNNDCVEIILDDKVPIYLFCNENKNNTIFNQTIIKDFIELIKYLNDSKDGKQEVQIEIKDDAKLYDIVEKLKDLTSDNFKKLFKDNDGLTLNKIISIFEYFLKIINECVISDISEQQDNDIDEDVKNKLDNYFQNKHLLKKEDLAYAIKLFMALVLFLEDDKENKIKSNSNNIVNYLKTTDLWKYDINDETFINDLNDLKSLNIKINQLFLSINI